MDAGEAAVFGRFPVRPTLDRDAGRLERGEQRVQLCDAQVQHECLIRREVVAVCGEGREDGHAGLLLPEAVAAGLDPEVLAIPGRTGLRVAAAEEESADARDAHAYPPPFSAAARRRYVLTSMPVGSARDSVRVSWVSGKPSENSRFPVPSTSG